MPPSSTCSCDFGLRTHDPAWLILPPLYRRQHFLFGQRFQHEKQPCAPGPQCKSSEPPLPRAFAYPLLSCNHRSFRWRRVSRYLRGRHTWWGLSGVIPRRGKELQPSERSVPVLSPVHCLLKMPRARGLGSDQSGVRDLSCTASPCIFSSESWFS